MKAFALPLLASLLTGCIGGEFTAGGSPDPVTIVTDGGNARSQLTADPPAAADDAGAPAVSDPPQPRQDAGAPPLADPPDAGEQPRRDAGAPPQQADACVPLPYLSVCPAAASNWPLCGRHSDGCGGTYDCGEPCPEPASSDAGGTNGDACAQLTACNGCYLVGQVMASQQGPCDSAVTADSAAGCQSYLSALRASGVSCN